MSDVSDNTSKIAQKVITAMGWNHKYVPSEPGLVQIATPLTPGLPEHLLGEGLTERALRAAGFMRTALIQEIDGRHRRPVEIYVLDKERVCAQASKALEQQRKALR